MKTIIEEARPVSVMLGFVQTSVGLLIPGALAFAVFHRLTRPLWRTRVLTWQRAVAGFALSLLAALNALFTPVLYLVTLHAHAGWPGAIAYLNRQAGPQPTDIQVFATLGWLWTHRPEPAFALLQAPFLAAALPLLWWAARSGWPWRRGTGCTAVRGSTLHPLAPGGAVADLAAPTPPGVTAPAPTDPGPAVLPDGGEQGAPAGKAAATPPPGGVMFVPANPVAGPPKAPEVALRLFDAQFRAVPLLVNRPEEWAWKFLERRKWRIGAVTVCPKVRLEDIIRVDGADPAARNRIKSRHVDFLLVDGAWRPVLAVEVDGGAHDNPERRERDAFVDGTLADAGVPVLHLPVRGPNRLWDELLAQLVKAHRECFQRGAAPGTASSQAAV